MGVIISLVILLTAIIIVLTFYYMSLRREQEVPHQQQEMEAGEELAVDSSLIKEEASGNPPSQETKSPNMHEDFPQGKQQPVLPEKYEKTFVRLLVRDPGWLYTYWEVNNKAFHENRSVLRLFIGDQNSYQDINISSQTREWFISGVKPREKYRIEIGFYKNGIFHPLASSRTVTTPTNRPSDNLDQAWMYIEELSRYSYRIDINATLSIIKNIEDRKKKAQQNISSLQLQDN